MSINPACAIPGDAWQDAQGHVHGGGGRQPGLEIYGRTGLQTDPFPKIETFLYNGDIGIASILMAIRRAQLVLFHRFASKYLK